MPRRASISKLACGWIVATGFALAGCATSTPPARPAYDFFGPPQPAKDPWHEKVSEWQQRAQVQHPGVSIRGEAGLEAAMRSEVLSRKIGAFEADSRLELARRISLQSRLIARWHYVFDEVENSPDDVPSQTPQGQTPRDIASRKLSLEIDHWPTYPELIEKNGDDCDGLDLIAYQLLREFGFDRDRIYRAVVMRDEDRSNHMVTLWFEDPVDPWVFDATGAVTTEFIRFSELIGWTPTSIFNETEQYSVAVRDARSRTGSPLNP